MVKICGDNGLYILRWDRRLLHKHHRLRGIALRQEHGRSNRERCAQNRRKDRNPPVVPEYPLCFSNCELTVADHLSPSLVPGKLSVFQPRSLPTGRSKSAWACLDYSTPL